MGARPLRRAIQRFVEDPLADEVLRHGEITPSTTVLIERDPDGDDERPLKLKLVKPRKRPKKKPEPVGVGAKQGDEGGSDDGTPDDKPSGDDEGAAEPSAN
jgi:ATP-dependent Clp protease ATP-binding subunit ClpC